ncbi:MAG: RHS repeat-associated core domain-containing protein [Deltaproteobacteria bacterium]|nr:RHS repeat-associated core domain-containing protein [Deltaproteobacteria bacterium]
MYQVDAFDHLGRPLLVQHGGAATTRLSYDGQTERLVSCSSVAANGTPLQGLSYTHDALGNIVRIADASRPAVYAGNAKHAAVNDYRYDGLYRLVEATGREHIGQIDGKTPRTSAPVVAAEPNDAGALRQYVQRYRYDAAGNLLRLEHAAGTGSYTRVYAYGDRGNRLRATGRHEAELCERYRHDAGGHMLAMPHVDDLRWNEVGELDRVRIGTMTAYFQYAGGVRVRKYVVKGGSVVEDRRVVDGVEVFIKGKRGAYGAVQVTERTETEVFGDAGLRIDRKTKREGVACDVVHWRYALQDHLGSVAVEVDRTGKVISREAYHPWGTTAVRAVTSELGVSPRRHRYLARERDDETGLALHGARYYAPWLGRWTAADPIGLAGGCNRYAYCRGSPVTFSDVDGCDAAAATDPAVRAAIEQMEATREEAEAHLWRSQMRHSLDGVDGVDGVDIAAATASASEALYGPELPEASWAGAIENAVVDAVVSLPQLALVPLMWEPEAAAVRWAGELEVYKQPYRVREEDRDMQAASEYVVLAATVIFEPGAAATANSLGRRGVDALHRFSRAALRRVRAAPDDAVKVSLKAVEKVDLSAGEEFIGAGVRSEAREASAIGFSSDAVASAYEGMRSGGGHAMRHLIDEGLIANSGSLASRARLFEQLTSPILRNPVKSFSWRLGATAARAFAGEVGGRRVVVFVAKEGPYQGRVLSAVVPDASQIAQWGL